MDDFINERNQHDTVMAFIGEAQNDHFAKMRKAAVGLFVPGVWKEVP